MCRDVAPPPSSGLQKLTRRDVEELIARRGGTVGLDLSGCDLAGVDLSRLDLKGAIFGNSTLAKNPKGAAITACAVLDGAWFERCDLTRAHFGRASLREAHFYKANLTEATLWSADARGADFREAILVRADLYSTVLAESRLGGADMRDANLHLADLRGADISAAALGGKLLQEQDEAYRQYFEQWYTPIDVRHAYGREHLEGRLAEACEIYRNVKSALLGAGRYDDASWAYFKERQMERKALSPLNGRIDKATRRDGSPISRLGRYIYRSFRWLVSLLAETTIGYGERPLRAAVWCLGIIAVFPFLYWWSGGIANLAAQGLTPLDYVLYSLAAFSTIGFPDLVPVTAVAKALSSVEALLGISALALLMFALGNRISRS